MRKPWAAVAAIVVCLALGGLPALGQEESTALERRAVFVEGEVRDCTWAGHDRWREDGVIYARTTGVECAGNYSDPRLNGTWRIAEYYDACFTASGEVTGPATCIYWSEPVVADEDGSWSGHETCHDIVQTMTRRCMGVYEGGGAYEGLTYIESYENDLATLGQRDLHGIIYEGPPPAWEVPSPPSG